MNYYEILEVDEMGRTISIIEYFKDPTHDIKTALSNWFKANYIQPCGFYDIRGISKRVLYKKALEHKKQIKILEDLLEV